MTPRHASLAALCAALAAAPAAADTVTCRDGARYTGVIAGETPTHFLLRVGGAEIFLARSTVVSVARSTPEENRLLSTGWERLNTHFKDESAQAEKESPPPPAAPPPQPTPEPAAGPDVDLADVPVDEPAEDYADAPEPRPVPDNPVDQRLAWKREVHAQVHRKNVVPGMTQREVRSAWGYPDLTHPVHGVYDYTDQWVYKRGGGRTVVYFRNGAVTGIRENAPPPGFNF